MILRDDCEYFIEKLKTELEGTGKYLQAKEDILKSPDLPLVKFKAFVDSTQDMLDKANEYLEQAKGIGAQDLMAKATECIEEAQKQLDSIVKAREVGMKSENAKQADFRFEYRRLSSSVAGEFGKVDDEWLGSLKMNDSMLAKHMQDRNKIGMDYLTLVESIENKIDNGEKLSDVDIQNMNGLLQDLGKFADNVNKSVLENKLQAQSQSKPEAVSPIPPQMQSQQNPVPPQPVVQSSAAVERQKMVEDTIKDMLGRISAGIAEMKKHDEAGNLSESSKSLKSVYDQINKAESVIKDLKNRGVGEDTINQFKSEVGKMKAEYGNAVAAAHEKYKDQEPEPTTPRMGR